MMLELLNVMPAVSRCLRGRRYAEARELLGWAIPDPEMVTRALYALILTEPVVQREPVSRRGPKGPIW